MKLLQTINLITEAKVSSPHLSSLTTAQLLDLYNRKQGHYNSTVSTEHSGVHRTSQYEAIDYIMQIPELTNPRDQGHYIEHVRSGAPNGIKANMLTRFYTNPSQFYVDRTGVKWDDQFSAISSTVNGKPMVIIGDKQRLLDYGLDEDDFNEYADTMERLHRRGGRPNLKGQISRLEKKKTEEDAAALATPAGGLIHTMSTPERTVPNEHNTKSITNPYYLGDASTRYNGPIAQAPWKSGLMKNMMTVYSVAMANLGDPIVNIQMSAINSGKTDVFLATTQSGQVRFMVWGDKSNEMVLSFRYKTGYTSAATWASSNRGGIQVGQTGLKTYYKARDPAGTASGLLTSYWPKQI